ncbi:MAG: tetratricopeptide repeat protein [Betaproteobacteria bacterium]
MNFLFNRYVVGSLSALTLASAALAQVLPRSVDEPTPNAPKVNLPKVDLTPDLIFKLLMGEVALDRNQPRVGLRLLMDAARQTNDPRVAQRVTEVAMKERQFKEAMEAASLWLKNDPTSAQARQLMAALLVNQQRLADAQPYLEQWLSADKTRLGSNLVQLTQLLARYKDKKAALSLLKTLAAPYADNAQAHVAVAQAAWSASEPELSLTEARAALAIAPDMELAALFVAQALQLHSDEEAMAFVADYLKRYPTAIDVRMSFTRLLVNKKKVNEALEQFELLTAGAPQNPKLEINIATLALSLEQWDVAEAHFKAALSAGFSDPDIIALSLGEIEERRKHYVEALKWYAEVKPGERYVNAQARYAAVLVKQGNLEAGNRHLEMLLEQNTNVQIQLIQAQANLLREAKAYQRAFDVLDKALKSHPDVVDLLYDQGMMAEKIERFDVLEKNFRRVIQLRPDNAQAYNALGYTLADRKIRLSEANQLIKKALELSPNDPYILDSQGWVYFRLGELRQAESVLRQAFKLRPEAEVGAHLGEVLWENNQREEAKRLWTDLIKNNAANETLLETIKRLAADLIPIGK